MRIPETLEEIVSDTKILTALYAITPERRLDIFGYFCANTGVMEASCTCEVCFPPEPAKSFVFNDIKVEEKS